MVGANCALLISLERCGASSVLSEGWDCVTVVVSTDKVVAQVGAAVDRIPAFSAGSTAATALLLRLLPLRFHDAVLPPSGARDLTRSQTPSRGEPMVGAAEAQGEKIGTRAAAGRGVGSRGVCTPYLLPTRCCSWHICRRTKCGGRRSKSEWRHRRVSPTPPGGPSNGCTCSKNIEHDMEI